MILVSLVGAFPNLRLGQLPDDSIGDFDQRAAEEAQWIPSTLAQTSQLHVCEETYKHISKYGSLCMIALKQSKSTRKQPTDSYISLQIFKSLLRKKTIKIHKILRFYTHES